MTLSVDDIRAAVTTGAINEQQAAQIIALADARKGHRENLSGVDEPFELFKSFNEIFIVVGLSVLYSGWSGIVGATLLAGPAGLSFSVVLQVISLGVTCGLASYFTLRRRMVAPSIALAVMFAISASWLGGSVGTMIVPSGTTWPSPQIILSAAAMATALLIGFWAWFRIPFTMLLIAIGVFVTVFHLTVLSGADYTDIRQVFLLSASGPFSILTIGLGIVGLIVALMFDMSDPHRVTRRAANGFWLHIIAAPAIVNTVALTLFNDGSAVALLLLFGFLVIMALLAVVIDRRSFLVSGVGYVVALAISIADGGASYAIFFLGVGLVLLGAFWEKLRAALMQSLPNFPGKNRLPPWQAPTPTNPAIP